MAAARPPPAAAAPRAGCRAGPRLLRLLLLLSTALLAPASGVTSGRTPSGSPVCDNGVWTEEPDQAKLLTGEALPMVQCWRATPCVQSHYMTFERCAAMVEESDFPARDPLLNVTPGMRTMADLARGVLANKTVLWVGDSIMGQTFDAARCDLLRWGLHLVQLHNAEQVSKQSAAVQLRAGRYLRWVAHKKPVWFPDPPQPPWVVVETETIVAFKGWHKYRAEDCQAFLHITDVVVVNYALHYNDDVEYAEAMDGLFRSLGAFALRPGKAAVFRETGAQHFIGTGSYSDPAQARLGLGSTCSCHAMAPEVAASNAVTKRNDAAAAAAGRHPAVRTLRMYDLTVPRHDLHEESFCDYEQRRGGNKRPGSCCDCTHLCYTPQFWGHLWERLAAELDLSNIAKPPVHHEEEEGAHAAVLNHRLP